MSRLDSFIRRLEAQRACLALALYRTRLVEGIVVELGLGNGRTYDHLRRRLNGRRQIYAFDRRVLAHPDCVPPERFLVLGDFRATLPRFSNRFAGRAALVHADIGSGDLRATADLARWLGPVLRALPAPGGVVVSDQPLPGLGWPKVAPPKGVAQGRYFIYRRPKDLDRRSPARGRTGSASRAPRAGRDTS